MPPPVEATLKTLSGQSKATNFLCLQLSQRLPNVALNNHLELLPPLSTGSVCVSLPNAPSNNQLGPLVLNHEDPWLVKIVK